MRVPTSFKDEQIMAVCQNACVSLRVKPGRTRREDMLHIGTPTFYTEKQADPHIETDHEKVHVITKTKAGYNTHSIQFSGVTIACSRTS